jgi:lipoic acid synthetase
MVDRDDLLDGGAAHMGQAVRSLHRRQPDLLVETLVGDFGGRSHDVAAMVESGPDVFAHNIEVTRALTPTIRDQRCDYDQSLRVLQHAKQLAPERLVKSSIMVGLGETKDQVIETMADLRQAGVDIVTVGQYLRPTAKHAKVARYVTPAEFEEYERAGYELGFAFVASGPLVRSSYHAAEGFVQARLKPGAGSVTPQEGVPFAPRELGAGAEPAPEVRHSQRLISAEQLLRRGPSAGSLAGIPSKEPSS